MTEASRPQLRLDKWLWQARFFKTRSLATRIVAAGGVRVNSVKVSKASRMVTPGDTLTFMQGRAVRVVRIEVLGDRRGPAPEAYALYTDLSPPPPLRELAARGYDGKGRPGKKERRNAVKSRSPNLE
ncbi:MAG: RNA-binding S4 domain-containing protein [Pseudomonadota bacterium]